MVKIYRVPGAQTCKTGDLVDALLCGTGLAFFEVSWGGVEPLGIESG